jgi:hypothetical protein
VFLASPAHRSLLVAALLTAPSCTPHKPTGGDDAAPSASSSAAGTASAPSPGGSGDAAPAPSASAAAKVALEVQRFVLTSEVKNKVPVDELVKGGVGDRVYAHLQVRNRGERRPLRLEFRIDGKVRSKIDLEVIHSWSYRTWGYNTVREPDVGKILEATIFDEDEVVASAKIPLAKTTVRKPLGDVKADVRRDPKK